MLLLGFCTLLGIGFVVGGYAYFSSRNNTTGDPDGGSPVTPTHTAVDISHESRGTPRDAPQQASESAALLTPRSRSNWEKTVANLDPLSQGWETEAFQNRASARLTALAKLLVHPERLAANQIEAFVGDGFICNSLRPMPLETVFDDRIIRVERAEIDAANVRPQSTGEHRQAAGLVEALTVLVAPLRDALEVHAKFKLFNVEPANDAITTRQYISISGRTDAGMVEQNATWSIRWAPTVDGGAPKMEWIGVEQFEQVTTHTPTGPLLADVTESVFASCPSYRTQLVYGVDHWTSHIEKRHLISFYGHQGLAIGDVDGDGLDDLYVCQSGGLPNLLFIRQPDGTLRDQSAESRVDVLDSTHSALLVDIDNDGDQDLIVATAAGLMAFENDGQARFRPRARILEGYNALSLAAADYDGDGNLDLYLCQNHRPDGKAESLPQPVPYHDAENGTPNQLLRSDGNWKFVDVTGDVGLNVNNSRFSFAAAWEDYDNDGDLDLYVANDFGRNNLYRNNGERGFTDVAAEAGVEDIAAGMSVTWGDYNHDGWMDIYVSNMFSGAGNRITYQRQFKEGASEETKSQIRRLARGNTLFENAGDGTFRDVSLQAAVTQGRWAWASRFCDLNNDGWEDLLVANGYFTRPDTGDL